MPHFDDVLDGIFDTSSDTFPDGYANIPGGWAGGYANSPAEWSGGYGNAPQGWIGGYGNAPAGNTPAEWKGGYGNAPAAWKGGYGNAPGIGSSGHPVRPSTPAGPATNFRKPGGPLPGGAQPQGKERILSMKPNYAGENVQLLDGMQRVMKYVNDPRVRWQKYGVNLAIPMTRRGQVFDTEAVKKHFYEKNKGHVAGSLFGVHRKKNIGTPFDWPLEWQEKGLIWVCMRHPMTGRAQFYSHICKRHQQAGPKGFNFGHSSLSAGGCVIGAGEWIVEQGILTHISANSGHYQPTLVHLHQAMQHLKHVIDGRTKVYLYDQVEDEWVYMPAQQFLASPTGGGRYWAHPRAGG